MNKTKARLQILITAACFINGLLAGGNVYRYVIEVPAWRHLNIIQWGEYSRHADLGNGIFLFPFEAVVSTVLLLIISVIIFGNREKLSTAALPVYASAVFALSGLGFTFLAAPLMLHVRNMANDPQLLQQTFDNFHYWGLWRAVVQVASFCTSVWAVGEIYKTDAPMSGT